MGENPHQCGAMIRSGEEDWEEELEMETREGAGEGVPPEAIEESRMTLSPLSLAQAMLLCWPCYPTLFLFYDFNMSNSMAILTFPFPTLSQHTQNIQQEDEHNYDCMQWLH